MYNALLDRLPEDYSGWLIRTDFRVGIQIQMCLSDPELSEAERIGTALWLLYGNGVPDIQTAMEGLNWFMSCGDPRPSESEEQSQEPDVYSFEYDAGRISSAFKRVFHLDISREKLHWFEFVPMLGDLSGTAFTSVIDIRSTDESEVQQKKRAEFRKMKRRFSLPESRPAEEDEKISAVVELLKSN